MTKLLVILFSFLLPSALWASDVRSMDLSEVRNNARKQLFPGGVDEEPLKVQASLPILKIRSAVEEEEPPSPDEATD